MAQPNQGNQQSGDRDKPRDQKQGGSQNPGGPQGGQEGQHGDSERNRDRNQGGSHGTNPSQTNNPSQGGDQRDRSPSQGGSNPGGDRSGQGGMNR
jgi:hypothetical protein